MDIPLKDLPIVEFAKLIGFRAPYRETEWSYRSALAMYLVSAPPTVMYRVKSNEIQTDLETLGKQIMSEEAFCRDEHFDAYNEVFVPERDTHAVITEGKNGGKCQFQITFDHGVLEAEARRILRAEIKSIARGEVDSMIQDEVISALRTRYTPEHIRSVAENCVKNYTGAYWFRKDLDDHVKKAITAVVESERKKVKSSIVGGVSVAISKDEIEAIVRKVIREHF